MIEKDQKWTKVGTLIEVLFTLSAHNESKVREMAIVSLGKVGNKLADNVMQQNFIPLITKLLAKGNDNDYVKNRPEIPDFAPKISGIKLIVLLYQVLGAQQATMR